MSFAHQSWENGPGPTVGYKVAVHRPHYAGDGSNCRRQAQQQTPFYNRSSFNIAMHSASDVSQPSKDSLTVRSQTTAGPIDKASVPLRKVDPHELCTQAQPIDDSKRCQAIGLGLSESILDGTATVAKSKEQRKSSLHVHFQIVPQESNKYERRIVESKIANESPSSSASSSLGKASDSSSCLTQKTSEEEEVQSCLQTPLNHMSHLKDALPIKRGLSKFFNGKSRSFTSLADVSSIDDLAKPENPYAKKRKWLHGRGNDSRNQIGYPPCHSLSGSSKKSLLSRDKGNQVLLSTGSVFNDTSELSLAFVGLNGQQKRCTPRSYSLSDLEGSG